MCDGNIGSGIADWLMENHFKVIGALVTVTSGEGGMFVTNDTVLYEKVLTLSNHGRPSSTSKSDFWSFLTSGPNKINHLAA